MSGAKDSARKPEPAKDARTERLAAALRANLKRRKAQVRARMQAGKPVAAEQRDPAEEN